MAKDIYEDIAKRTGGDIYIGVVGPVRTGKSTLIKQLMEKLVIPNIPEESKRSFPIFQKNPNACEQLTNCRNLLPEKPL
ncbi:stage IV sporulation protein A [Ruminococcus sp. CAG:254]|nr:stage IV sporulation protein A [Ruminococcus sp. CAG:254]